MNRKIQEQWKGFLSTNPVEHIKKELDKIGIKMEYESTESLSAYALAYDIIVEPKMEGFELEDIIDKIIGEDESYIACVYGGRSGEELTGTHLLEIEMNPIEG